jgi:4-amino-4-deoxy-L-arabinose transferase-like glycosyltransferase
MTHQEGRSVIFDTPSASPAVAASAPQDRSRASSPRWEWFTLATILALAAVLNFYRLDQNGFGNTYYATTVWSMSRSWHNWFFASFDPGGFVTVDKPPLGFWLQVASVWMFGFHGAALLLPQAIAGTVSVWLLYRVVRQHFSGPAALGSALVLAVSPINVVSNRDNTLESLLVLVLLLAALALTQALKHGSLRWLLVVGVCLGLGFNIKMLEAYLVVPAFTAAYLLAAPLPWRARLLHLALAGTLMLLVSFAWIAAVELTPAASRPYVGSSYHNSELDLVFAYNGVQRLFGTPWTHAPQAGNPIGAPGPLRLFTSAMASQIAWWLPLAVVPLLVFAGQFWRALRRERPTRQLSPAQGMTLLWGAWLLTMVIFFSQAVFINVYYLAVLSPALAALAGIGLAQFWSAAQTRQWQGWVLLVGVVGTVGEQGIILSQQQTWNPWLFPVVALLAGLTAGILFARQVPARPTRPLSRAAVVGLTLTLGLAPLLWTCSSLHRDAVVGLPVSGPLQGDTSPAVAPSADPQLIAYLQQHRDGATFLAATVDTDAATPLIFSTGAPVMAMGGYTGFDPILTTKTLAEAIATNEVRFFYLPSSNLTPQQAQQMYPAATDFTTQYTNSLTHWVAQQCRAVPPDQWSIPDSALTTAINAMQLFDCSALVGG